MMRGCDLCSQDFDGYTAAHYAVERDDVEMLKALTIRFTQQTKPITEEQKTSIHNQCLKALTLKNKQGLTPFMLACHHESIKCLDYLIGLNINDCDIEVNYFLIFMSFLNFTAYQSYQKSSAPKKTTTIVQTQTEPIHQPLRIVRPPSLVVRPPLFVRPPPLAAPRPTNKLALVQFKKL